MKKYIYLTLIFIAIFFIAPIGLNAAYDDVTLTTDAVISVNGISLSVSGSSAVVESITVSATSFSVTLQTGSTFTVTSSARATFSVSSPKTIPSSTSCTSSASSLTLSGGDNVAVSVTPTSTACDTTTSTASSGGGGGGGSASAPGVVTTTPRLQIVSPDGTIEYLDEGATTQTTTVAQAETTTTTTATATTATNISSAFTKTLRRSASNPDIKRLQQLLNSDPDTRIAESGVGSAGNETNYFGSLTQKAVQKFQAKYGIVSSGTPETTGYGLVGPATRAKLAEVFGGTATTPATTPAASVATPSAKAVSVSPVFNKGLSRGASNSDIKRLQQLLNSDPDTAIAVSGVGSAGNETNYFGSLTEKAVQKFQIKHGVVSSPSEAGYGFVGPKTRAKLTEIFGQ